MAKDNWADRSTFVCASCMYYQPKSHFGRCKRHAPATSGFPVVMPSDFCGDHKLDHEKVSLVPDAPDS